ncbi:DUF5994 family protein [Nocardia sp. NPDC088792]|uniref:DUF5994 family protein n=1 Tax=Nocardia sp. NPDC088792 TaxID=3364332 RepID=UPI0038305C4B
MTSQPNETGADRQTSPAGRPRLELGADGTGSWRPYSRDLAGELPGLLAAVAPGLGPIYRVVYHLDEWEAAPRKLEFGGRRVRLDGYRNMAMHTLEILGVVIGARLKLRILNPADDTDTSPAQQLWDSEGGAVPEAWISERDRATSR